MDPQLKRAIISEIKIDLALARAMVLDLPDDCEGDEFAPIDGTMMLTVSVGEEEPA